MLKWYSLIFLALLLCACAGTTSLTDHTATYRVQPSHSDPNIQKYLDEQEFRLEVRYKSDSFIAHYTLGEASLTHIGYGTSAAILAAEFDHGKFKSELNRTDIENYLSLRKNYDLQKQPGKVKVDSFRCKKALIIYENGDTGRVVYQPKLRPENKRYEYGFSEVPGLPVKFTVREQDVLYKYQLVQLDSRGKDLKSSLPGNDYTEVPMKELLNKGIMP